MDAPHSAAVFSKVSCNVCCLDRITQLPPSGFRAYLSLALFGALGSTGSIAGEYDLVRTAAADLHLKADSVRLSIQTVRGSDRQLTVLDTDETNANTKHIIHIALLGMLPAALI
jgi:hypothetical protein